MWVVYDTLLVLRHKFIVKAHHSSAHVVDLGLAYLTVCDCSKVCFLDTQQMPSFSAQDKGSLLQTFCESTVLLSMNPPHTLCSKCFGRICSFEFKREICHGCFLSSACLVAALTHSGWVTRKPTSALRRQVGGLYVKTNVTPLTHSQ